MTIEEREKTAKIITNIFNKLGLDAKVTYDRFGNFDSMFLQVKCFQRDVLSDSFEEYSSDKTFREIINNIRKEALKYNPTEAKKEWHPGKGGQPEEPEFSRKFTETQDELYLVANAMEVFDCCKTIEDWELLDADEKEKRLKKVERLNKIQKIASVINDILNDLNVNAWINANPNEIILYTETSYGYDFNEEFKPKTLVETAEDIKDFAERYNWEEERDQWEPGENGAPEEPYLTEEFMDIGETMKKVGLAMETLLRIEKDKNKSVRKHQQIIRKYKRIIHKDEIEKVKGKAKNLILDMRGTGMDNKEILSIFKETLNELS